jgi:BirA family biotin operon repressor/biotin-[acetyl-CoA-carboxylase] ligase
MMDIPVLAGILSRSPNPWEIEFLETTDSTNTELSRRYSSHEDAPYLLLCADEQTAGRGRLNRSWQSIPGADITASAVSPSPVSRKDTPKLALAAGLALVEVLESEYGLDAKARWPNDVVTGRGKLAGILCCYLSKPHAVICGIGINVNSEPEAFPLGPHRSRTTTREELGYDIDREPLLGHWLLAFEAKWELADGGRIDELKSAFDNRSFYLGKRLKILVGAASERDEIRESPEEIEGIAGGLDDNGGMVVLRADNSMYSVGMDDVIIPLE